MMLTLSVSQSKAMDKCERESLVERMSNDNDVIDFSFKSIQIGFMHNITDDNIKSLSDEYQKSYRKILGKSLEESNIIKSKYPELADMDFDEKKEVFEAVYNSILAGNLGNCYWEHLKTFFYCEGFNGVYTVLKYLVCMGAVAAAAIFQLEITAGAEILVVEEEVTLGHKVCMKIALGWGTAFIGTAVCPGFFFENIASCRN